jgi:flavodoxin
LKKEIRIMNGPEIYYFSGTGNSFVVARDIAKKTGGKLISIATVMDTAVIRPNSDVIGIVFPVYFAWFGGIPLILERFAKKLEGIAGKYIFAVCTYGNGTGPALTELSKIIEMRGGEVNAGFAIQMPSLMYVGIYD